MKAGVLLIVLAALFGPFSLRAQQPGQARDDGVRHRNDCRLAAQAVSTGRPGPQYGWAIAILSTCREEGGPALAAAWGTLASANHDTLDALIFASTQLRDRRVLDAVVTTARDEGRPTLVRLAAMEVLISYYNPRLDLPLTKIEHPDPAAGLRSRVEFTPDTSADPVTAGDRPAIIATVEALATSGGDARVREAATVVAAGLRAQERSHSPGGDRP